MQALNSEESDYSMTIGDVNLELVRSIQPVKIIAKDVSLRRNNDMLSVNAPSLSLSFSVRALLKGIIAPSSVTVEQPNISIFTTYGIEKDKTNEINKKKVEFYIEWFEGFLDRFNSDEKIYPESYINEININGADVEFHEVDLGRKWHFNDVNFSFDRNLTDLEITAGGLLDMKDRLATLSIQGEYKPTNNRLQLDFNFADLVLSDLLDSLSDNKIKIEVPVEGKLSAKVNFNEIIAAGGDWINHLDDAVQNVSFNIKGSGGEVIFNADEKYNYAIDSFLLDGSINGGLDSVSIQNADFETGGHKTRLSLDISGYKKFFFERSLDDLKIIFAADIDKFQLDDLSKFWPRYLAEPAWQWCKENLYGGQAENGRFIFEFIFNTDTNSLYLSKLEGKADVADGNISYLEGMPPVSHVYGTAFFSDSSIRIQADKGVSDGVIITGGEVRLYDLDKKNNYIDINIKGNSSISDALRFIDNPPLNFAKGMGINPEQVSGEVEISLGLNFELHQELQPEDLKVDVKADLRNVRVPKALDGKDITADKLALEVNSKGFIVLGDAEFDNIPLNLVVNETFSNRAYKSKAKISFRLNENVKKKLGVNAAILNPPYINGYADVTADVTVLNDENIKIDVAADLTSASIDYSFLGFRKNKGQKSNLKTTLILADGKVKSVPSFSLSKNDFTLNGNMKLNSKGFLQVIDISQIKGPKTSAKAKIEYTESPKRKVKINVSGNSYDLTELFEQTEQKQSTQKSGSSDDDFTSVIDTDVFIAVNSLWTNGKTPIKNFAGSVMLRNGVGVEEAHMVGNYGSDKSIKLKLDYVPKPGGEYLLSIDSNNAGSTLKVLRLYDYMRGGILKIEAKRNKYKEFIGHAQIRDFSIQNTPLLAKLFSVASFTGMLDLLRGEGLSFSHFDAPFEYKNKTLYVKDAKMFGNVIGFTGSGLYQRQTGQIGIKGIISPAYSLNSFIGKIPLVGSVLAGKDGTIFAANYSIDGTLQNPKISINPLSVFSPNSLKDLFSAGE